MKSAGFSLSQATSYPILPDGTVDRSKGRECVTVQDKREKHEVELFSFESREKAEAFRDALFQFITDYEKSAQ